MNIYRILWRSSLCYRAAPISKQMMSYIKFSFFKKVGKPKYIMKLAPVQPYDTISWGSKALHEKLSFNRFGTDFTRENYKKLVEQVNLVATAGVANLMIILTI